MLSRSKTFGTFVQFGLVFALLASGCSLRAKSGPPSLYFDLRSFSQTNLVNGVVATNGFEDFACFAINVTGPGIEDSDIYRQDKDPASDFARTLAGSPCAYRGIVSPPIYVSSTSTMQGELALKLPTGPVRVVQLIGVKDIASCQNGFLDPDDGAGNEQNYYELARAEVRDFFQDRSVALPLVAWSTLTTAEQEARNMDSCQDGSAADTTPPAVVIANALPSLATASTVTVSGITATETIASHCVLVNSTSSTACSWVIGALPSSLNVTLNSGHEGTTNKVSIWAKDAAGNLSARADSNGFRFDSSGVVPTLSNAQVSVAGGATGKVNVTIADNGSTYHHTVCLIDSLSASPVSPGACAWIPVAASYQHTAVNGPSVYIHVFVKDSFGQMSTEAISNQVAVGI